jgi:ABC-type multidrug transport system ATPase subunit
MVAGRKGLRLRVDHVSKRYGRDVWGLRDCSLALSPGVLGLLGPNGAGKSTLMRILATVTRPTSGRVAWNDVDLIRRPDRIRAQLGYLPQDFGVYPHLTALEFLSYLASLKGLDSGQSRRRIHELMEALGLVEMRRRPLGTYSGGMRQRVGIAQALLNDPALLIVDEPTAGLDPGERVWFRGLLSELSGERIVILSTHIVSDVAEIATEIAVLDRGSLRVHAPPERLLSSMQDQVWDLVISEAEVGRLRERHAVSRVARRADGVHVRVISEEPPSPSATSAEPTLEDAYLGLVRRREAGLAAVTEA